MHRALRLVLRVVILAVVAAVLPASAALAAAVAGDDTMIARPTGAVDVLANDTGAGDLTITLKDPPAHGTATCKPLGGCFYEANEGSTSDDGFTYTLRDGDGNESVGHVNVVYQAPTASADVVAADDQAATLAGHPVTIDVLANDAGQGLTVTAPAAGFETARHGHVDCASDGKCTYTPPGGGFTGADGFTYTAHGSSDSNADVRILVVRPDAQFGLSTSGGPNTVGENGAANWSEGILADLAQEEIGVLPAPQVSTTLDGLHRFESAKGAKGWSVDGLSATAGPGALLGTSISEAFPRPLPPINTGTGGDGHVPILVGNKIFAFYHHSSPTSVMCVDRRTGQACAGYPITLSNNTNGQGWSTSDIDGPAVVIGSKIYVHLWPYGNYSYRNNGYGGYTQTASIGVFCWDAAKNRPCGYLIFARTNSTNPSGASHPVQVGNKIYMAGDGGKLYCLDPATGDPCGSIDDGLLTDAGGMYDVISHGTRVYISRLNENKVSCIDVATGARCAGWATPQAIGNNFNVINWHDTDGTIIGVCVVGGGQANCVHDNDPGTVTNIPSFLGSMDDYYDVTEEAEAGTRTFFGSLSHSGVGCFDWKTNAVCTGPKFSGGWATESGYYTAYGATWDGSCVVALGDSQQAFTADFEGNSPCTSLSSGTNKRVVDLRDQRADGTVGGAKWVSVDVLDLDQGDLNSLTVTVSDAQTGEVLKSGQLLNAPQNTLRRGVTGRAAADVRSLDLSGIDPVAHPAVTLDATLTAPAGNHAWDDAIPPRLVLRWKADPQSVAVDTRSTAPCGTPAGKKLTLTGQLTGVGSSTATLDQGATSACAVPVKPQSAPPAKCGGARLFDIRVRFLGRNIRKLTVTVNGKQQKVLGLRKYRGRPVVRIDLRKLPKTTTVVKITIKTKSGKTLKGKRVYHPCRSKLPDRGFKY